MSDRYIPDDTSPMDILEQLKALVERRAPGSGTYQRAADAIEQRDAEISRLRAALECTKADCAEAFAENTRLRAERDAAIAERDEARRERNSAIELFKVQQNGRHEAIALLDAARAQVDKLAEALRPFEERLREIEKVKQAAQYAEASDVKIADLRAARAALSEYDAAKETQNGQE